MAKHLRITVEGKAYDVIVEDLTEDAGSTFYQVPSVGMAPAAPLAAPAAAAARPAAAAPRPTAPAAGGNDKLAPMGGVIVDINVKEGDAVKAGQQLLIMEAMKMKQIITSDRDGTVAKVLVKVGDTVDTGQSLMTIA